MLQDLKVLTLKISNMYNIVDATTGLLLFAKSDNVVLENQVAIEAICTIETTEPIYWDFENELFYTK